MARPYTGGSAIGLSATDAWAEPLPVMFNHAPYSKHWRVLFAAGQRKSKRFNRREFTQVALISDRHITIVLQAANEITGPADLGREPFDNMVSTGGRASAPRRSESDPLADFVPIVGHRGFVSKIAKHRMGAICA
jgi:hypothetical protein